MRTFSALALTAILLGSIGHAQPAFAFSKDITVTSVKFSSDFDTATITLSRDPGEKVSVLADIYIGNSTANHSGAETSQAGQTITLSGFRDDFESGGGNGTQFRLQWRVCPYQEPYVDQHLYQYCSAEYIMFVTYSPQIPTQPPLDAPAIRSAIVSSDKNTIAVELVAPIEKGYVEYKRYGSGAGYDYSSAQTRADNSQHVVIDIGNDFRASGTIGKQTITLTACVQDPSAADRSTDCGPGYPLTIDLSASASFLDVPPTHPNADAIQYVQQQGLVAGYPDGTFHPDAEINRAEFTKIVTIYQFGQEMINMCHSRVRFTDIPTNVWYLQYICRAQDADIVSGYPDGTFRPGNKINFAEAAKIIVLADKFGNPDKVLPSTTGTEWYEAYIRYLASYKAIPITINPLNANLTRGEMAEIIYRLRAHVTTKPSKTYEDFTTADASALTRYTLLSLPSYAVKNYDRNTVYRYSITAPSTGDIVIKTQTFTLDGGRWSGPQLRIFSDTSHANQLDTWEADDNWTTTNSTTLHGTFVIPSSQTRYFELNVNIGIPADRGFTVTAKQEFLAQITLMGQ